MALSTVAETRKTNARIFVFVWRVCGTLCIQKAVYLYTKFFF